MELLVDWIEGLLSSKRFVAEMEVFLLARMRFAPGRERLACATRIDSRRIRRAAAYTKWPQFRGRKRTKREFHGSVTTKGKKEIEASCVYLVKRRSFTLGTT